MSATIKYKGSTLTTVNNQTKTLETAGTWLEDDIEITDVSSGGEVIIVDTPDSHGGTVRTITTTGSVSLQSAKPITPSATEQTVYPDSGYDGMASVVVAGGHYDINDICERNFGAIGDLVIDEAEYIGPYTFFANTGLTSVSSDTVTRFKLPYGTTPTWDTIGSYAFARCTNLTSVSFTNLTDAGSGGYQFGYCTKLTDVYLPKATFIGQRMFIGCTSLQTVAFQAATATNGYGFYGCTNLETADVQWTNFNNNEFNGCTKLKTIIIRSASVAKLSNINNFTNTPFNSGGTGGTIYIPKSLHDHLGDGSSSDYKAATNWATIDGYGTITWAKIEGSIYENQYADGRPIS